jgi:AcrR family transcriptional regulator
MVDSSGEEARTRKKQQTRQRIADTAIRLFSGRDFDAVTVAEIARAAGVTEKTVFNHFGTKEDLVYSNDQAFETALLDSVRTRLRGEPVLEAVERFLLNRYRRIEFDTARRHRAQTLATLVTDSRALQTRERQIHARYADLLCELITTEQRAAPDDIRPRIAAEALITVHRESIAAFRNALLADLPDNELAQHVVTTARHGFALLAHGLSDYASRTDHPDRTAPAHPNETEQLDDAKTSRRPSSHQVDH